MKVIKYKQNMSGFALIEVLVSVVVLALGILALLATQLRAVASVHEAETQTIAAQAAQNLIEGMLANPQLELRNGKTIRKYNHYKINGFNDIPSRPAVSPYDQVKLAEKQLIEFREELQSRLGDMAVQAAICNDGNLTDIKPTIDNNGTFNAGCDGSIDTLAIKIAWVVRDNAGNPQTVDFQTYVRNQ